MEKDQVVIQLKAHLFTSYPVYLLLVVTVLLDVFNSEWWLFSFICAIAYMFSNQLENKRLAYIKKHTSF